MSKLTLHSSLQSWSSVCVELLLALTNVDAQREHYDLTPGLWTTRNSKTLRSLNPARRVPVLVEEGGFVLTESTAIMRFIVDSRLTDRPEWYRAEPHARAKVDGKLSFIAACICCYNLYRRVVGLVELHCASCDSPSDRHARCARHGRS
jgi:glutathione S-transferase